MYSNEPFAYYLQQAEQKLSGRNRKNQKRYMENVVKLALKLQSQYCGSFVGMTAQTLEEMRKKKIKSVKESR